MDRRLLIPIKKEGVYFEDKIEYEDEDPKREHII